MEKLVKTLLLLLLLFVAKAEAQQTEMNGRQSLRGIEVHFRFDKHYLDMDYMGNASALREFATVIDSIGAERIDSVIIVSQSSPEGVYAHNLKLSERRARTMRRYIEQHHPDLGTKLAVHPDGESWLRLRDYVSRDTLLRPSTITRILSVIDADVSVETKKWRMAQLPVYRYLLSTYYPRIRNSMFYILFYDDRPVPPMPEPAAIFVDTLLPPMPVPNLPRTASVSPVTLLPRPADKQGGVYVALKTNLLYDALLVPNAGAEVWLGRQWSLSAYWMYAWWKTDRKHWYWRTYGGDVALRRWLGGRREEKPLTGHHLGLYVQMLTYDFETGNRGYLSDRWSYAAGVEYGYSLPIASRLHLDFVLGVGYMGGTYKEYLPMDGCYVWQSTKQRHYWGPTKAEVSLVWHLGWLGRKGGGL